MGIGYHYVILNGYSYSSKECLSYLDGSVEVGRSLGRIGAHVYGHNKDSIGICLIGKPGEFTHRQYRIAKAMILSLLHKYDLFISDVVGHCELDSKKPHCPGFDMKMFSDYLNDIVGLEKIVGIGKHPLLKG
jgi:N-acetyl-anhydromuramyl-L-alanine amidase AmpD